MKHLVSPILEFVLNQPAHRLPAVFTREKFSLPDCSESPEDVFAVVLGMQQQELIKAHVIRGIDGKPRQVEIQYVTLAGKIHLESRNVKNREGSPSGRLVLWGAAALIALGLILFLGGNGLFSPSHGRQNIEISKTESATESTPPAASPSPSASPETAPAYPPAPAPSVTPGSLPVTPVR